MKEGREGIPAVAGTRALRRSYAAVAEHVNVTRVRLSPWAWQVKSDEEPAEASNVLWPRHGIVPRSPQAIRPKQDPEPKPVP